MFCGSRATPQAIAEALGRSADEVATQRWNRARAQLLAAREKRPTPYVDTTIYTSWNAMFVSAYLEAASALDGDRGRDCRAFALRTLDRLLAEGWDDRRGFAHRLGGERLDGIAGRSGVHGGGAARRIRGHAGPALLRCREARTRACASKNMATQQGGGFFDRSSDAAPMGGLDVRRKPLQDSPTPAAIRRGDCA